MCVCGLRYPARKAHAPYCHLWPVWLYKIFSTLSYKRHDFRKKKKSLNIKCLFWFSLENMSKTVLILRRTKRDVINVYMGLHYCFQILMKVEFSLQILGKFSCQISWKYGSRVVPCRRTDGRNDRHEEAKSHFHNLANAPKIHPLEDRR